MDLTHQNQTCIASIRDNVVSSGASVATEVGIQGTQSYVA